MHVEAEVPEAERTLIDQFVLTMSDHRRRNGESN
jgi:hypothetical protein